MQETDEDKNKQATKAADAVLDVTRPSIKIATGADSSDNNPNTTPESGKAGAASAGSGAANLLESISVAEKSGSGEKKEKGAEMIGKLIASKYQVLSYIGSGGMSTVFLVKHLLLNKTLALKMIHPHLASDKESLARFQREAEATSRLDHQNLVKVHDFGISEDGSPFIIMDYIEGGTLSNAISSRTLTPDRVVHIISQACDALAHAHSRSVVHRDIKPSNIMLVANEGNQDFVKVVDFGIAQLVVEDAEVARLTQTGQIFGTPMYMSPEQCQGLRLDARTDIYSLACVMYEALTGKTPFAGSSVYELIFKQINEAPAALGSELPDRKQREALETIIFRALAKDPSDRYQTMETLKDDLDNINEAPDTGFIGSVQRFFRQWYFRQLTRNLKPMLTRMPVTAMSIILVCAVSFAALLPQIQNSSATPELWKKLDKEGQEQFDHGKKKEALDTFNTSLEVAKKLKDKTLMIASLDEILDVNRAIGNQTQVINIESEIKSLTDPKVIAAQLLLELESETKKISGKVTDPKQADELRAFCGNAIDTGMTQSDASDRQTAKSIVLAAKQLVEKAFGSEDPLMVRCQHNLANIAHNESRYEDAIAGYKATLQLEESVLPTFDSTKAKTLQSLARVYMQTGFHLDEAEALLKKAIEINRKSFGPESSQLAKNRFHLASLYRTLGRRADAKREIMTAIAIYERSEKEEDKLALANSYNMLGAISADASFTTKALASYEETRSKDYQGLGQVLLKMSELALQQKDAVIAQAYLDRATAISARFTQADQDMFKTVTLPLQSAIYQKQGHYDLAENELKKALQNQDHDKDGGQLHRLALMNRMAGLLAEAQKPKEAEEFYKRIFEAIDADNSLKSALGNAPFLGYVHLLNAQNRQMEARALAERWKKLN